MYSFSRYIDEAHTGVAMVKNLFRNLISCFVIFSTGPKDTLFIYVVGLASFQYLTFPFGPGIAARKLAQNLESLTRDHKFEKVNPLPSTYT